MTNHLPFSLSAFDLQMVSAFSTQLSSGRRKKIALVVQGGGQRGIFTAGVFDSFLEAGFDPFELYIGTSAGALNLSSFISRQSSFSYNFIVNYTTDDEFFNLYKYLSKQKPMNLDWALDTISAEGLTPLDIVTARRNLQYRQAFACATRKDTLEDIYLPMYQENWRDVLRATCAIPMLYNQPVNLQDLEWVDGGVSAAVPVQEAWKRGADLVVVVRTEPLENSDDGVRVFDDWREKIESSLPQYIEKLNLNQSLEKFKSIHNDLTQRFELWKEGRNDKVIEKEQQRLQEQQKVISELIEPKKMDADGRKWFTSDNIERFLSITGKGKSSEVIEMLARYYQTCREVNEFLVQPPEGLKVIQIAPDKRLRSRALLSEKDDLEVDYREGKLIGRQFVEHFSDALNETTKLDEHSKL